MISICTRAKLALTLLAITAAPAGAAFAGEGNGPSFPGYQVLDTVIATPVAPSVSASQSQVPSYNYSNGAVTIGGTLPPNGSQGEPEPINSLPPGFADGTSTMLRRQSLQRYWADQTLQAEHLAEANQQPNG